MSAAGVKHLVAIGLALLTILTVLVAKPKPQEAAPASTFISSRGAEARVCISLNVVATAYSYPCSRLTATGVRPRIGIIAVDPAVIPLHSLLYVPGYGYGWAEDTGKLIKGNSVDLFMKTKGTAFKWGRKPVTVIIFLQKKRGAKGAA